MIALTEKERNWTRKMFFLYGESPIAVHDMWRHWKVEFGNNSPQNFLIWETKAKNEYLIMLLDRDYRQDTESRQYIKILRNVMD